jgi:hypothetical protein
MPRWLLWTAAVVSEGVWAVLATVFGDGRTGGQTQALSTVGILRVVLALARSKDLGPASWQIHLPVGSQSSRLRCHNR